MMNDDYATHTTSIWVDMSKQLVLPPDRQKLTKEIAKDCLLTLVKSRLALGSPGCLVGWLFVTMPKMAEYTEISCWLRPVQPITPQYSLLQPTTAQFSLVKPSTVQYSPVQPTTAQYSPVQSSAAQCSPVQPTTTLYSPKQPSTSKLSPVEPGSAQYSLVQPITAQYSPLNPSTIHYSPTQPITAKQSQVQPNTVHYIPEQLSKAHYRQVQPSTGQYSTVKSTTAHHNQCRWKYTTIYTSLHCPDSLLHRSTLVLFWAQDPDCFWKYVFSQNVATPKLSKTKRSHPKLYPHLINNIQSELSGKTRTLPTRLYPCPTILLGLAARRAALA